MFDPAQPCGGLDRIGGMQSVNCRLTGIRTTSGKLENFSSVDGNNFGEWAGRDR
jgi:hypothetical protein